MAASWGVILVGGPGPNSSGVLAAGTTANPLADCPGGKMVFAMAGTLAPATGVKLQVLGPDGVTLIDTATASNLTAPGMVIVELAPCQVVATIAGGPAGGMFVTLSRVVD